MTQQLNIELMPENTIPSTKDIVVKFEDLCKELEFKTLAARARTILGGEQRVVISESEPTTHYPLLTTNYRLLTILCVIMLCNVRLAIFA